MSQLSKLGAFGLTRRIQLQQQLEAYRKNDWKRFDLVKIWGCASIDELPAKADMIEQYLKESQ